jgi:NADPH-dependent glutamate synthase beta subunit-like oxidoreductase/NAD-dependent dihydropyrimidine dehydrogenase PreA subunit
MMTDRKRIESLLEASQPDEAIEALIQDGVPEQPWQHALLARAYGLRGDSRGDLYAAAFFAKRAHDAGFNEPWLTELAAQRHRAAAEKQVLAPRQTLGGIHDTRREGPTPYAFNATSTQLGYGYAPKDLDWTTRNIPCQKACPAHTDIPGYLTAIYDGDYAEAYRINLESNVFPGVLGRVCARPCEGECRHGWDDLGESVAICFSKRAAADLKVAPPVVLAPWFDTTGKRIAVVGAGVAGLTAARNLARFGHHVTVLERHSEPGGMMVQGIPEFRLPRDVITREIEQITALGVEIQCNTAVGEDITLDELSASYDAVILAAGTLRPNLLNLPGKELAGVRHGLDFLLEANTAGTATVGRHVVVIGGGFTAMDCARTAKRIGSPASVLDGPENQVSVWYRRTQEEMLITPGELEELQHEKIPMAFLVSPVRYIGKDGHVTAIECIRNELGAPDASGRRRPVPIAGSEFQIPADTVLLATGQFPETDWITGEQRDQLVGEDQWLTSGKASNTGVTTIFAAGDFAQGANSLIAAIGHARKASREVDAYLMGELREVKRVLIRDASGTGRIREMDAVPVTPMPTLPLNQRNMSAEVETGYSPALAVDETQRCYRCHYKFEIDSDKCIYCDWCVRAKPRPECILKVKALEYDDTGCITGWDLAEGSDDTYLVWINQQDCIRCGACVDACPVDAISVQAVNRENAPACEGCSSTSSDHAPCHQDPLKTTRNS